MIKGLLKLVLLIVLVGVVAAFLLGWWGSGRLYDEQPREVVGTSGEKAREAAAEVGQRTAQAADKAGDKAAEAAQQARKAMAEGSLTAKIKAKMALDDHVKALNLNVDTVGSVVTVTGLVNTQAEKDRALLLARDTVGVTQVVDRIQLRR
jgi:hyperosmotically inducible protein